VSLSVDPRIGSGPFGYPVEALLGRGGMSVGLPPASSGSLHDRALAIVSVM